MSESVAQDASVGREAWLARLARMFSAWGAGDADALRERFERPLAACDDATFAEFGGRLETTGAEFGFHPFDPVARALSRTTHGAIALPGSGLESAALQEDPSPAGPLIFLGNHLSFIDANTFDWLLVDAGLESLADRLTVLAGPKVYSEAIRRLASLCFGTIKIPQSPSRASGEAVMSRREVLRLATQTLAHVRKRRAQGEHLLIFAEGSRSRIGGMQRVLPATVRYLEDPWAKVVPFGLTGTEKLVPLDEDHAYPTVVRGRLGTPIDAGALYEAANGKRALVADAIGYLIAALLPEPYRGCYADPPADSDDGAGAGDPKLAAAREIARRLSPGAANRDG